LDLPGLLVEPLRRRLAIHYDAVIEMFWDGAFLVTLPGDGPPVETSKTPRPRTDDRLI